ncbi:MAG TPA: T9SS type A sorting domain-containing protein [Bacteroidia bacterium]|jgi:hypothetical protein|nr:T9SS type A sorting domain-containing protein [Bacteroidia bacterium]
MKKIFTLFTATIFTVTVSKAQVTTAMDFNSTDCNSNMVHLFPQLDNGEVVILEFFMNCASCINAGQKITPMFNALAAQYPGYVHYDAFTYNNSMTCTTANSVIIGNGINATVFDSGAAQVAYYGGFGMPTIVVVAGNQHQVLFSHVGFSTSDTTTMGQVIRNFFATGVNEQNAFVSSMNVYPNPSSTNINLNFDLTTAGKVTVQIVDNLGQTVAVKDLGELSAGNYSQVLTTENLTAGSYFVRLQTGESVLTKRIVIAQ